MRGRTRVDSPSAPSAPSAPVAAWRAVRCATLERVRLDREPGRPSWKWRRLDARPGQLVFDRPGAEHGQGAIERGAGAAFCDPGEEGREPAACVIGQER